MDKIVTRVKALKCSNGSYVFIPATKADRRYLDSFCGEAGNQIITVTAEIKRQNKTYEQIKAAWALIEIICEVVNGHKPIGEEAEQMCLALYDMFAETYTFTNPMNPEETVTRKVTMSKMSKWQLANFINCLINFLANECDLNTEQQVGVKEIYQQYMDFRSSLKIDFVDTDEDGNFIPLDKFRELNTVSFASGIGGLLDVAHIVSKGTAPQYRDCSWNVCMFTHEEHMLQHDKGWDSFLEIYPHLKGRVERARNMAHKLGLETQKVPQEMVDEAIGDIF